MKEVTQAIPEVEIMIGETKHTIRCSFGLLARFQKVTGLNPFDAQVWAEPSPMTFASLIWAGLIKANPTLTVEDVADSLSIRQATQVKDILIGMMESGIAEKKEEAPAAQATPETPTVQS